MYGGYILIDIPAFVLTLLTASFLLDKKYFVSGLILGIAFLFKFPVIAIIPVLIIYIIFWIFYPFVQN